MLPPFPHHPFSSLPLLDYISSYSYTSSCTDCCTPQSSEVVDTTAVAVVVGSATAVVVDDVAVVDAALAIVAHDLVVEPAPAVAVPVVELVVDRLVVG